MAELLLDVTVFEDYRAGDPGARAVIDRAIDGDISVSVSPITVFQLWGDPSLDRQSEIGSASMISFMEQAPLSAEAAKLAGRWLSNLDSEQRAALAPTALVAATAKERGERICTRDPEVFGPFDTKAVGYGALQTS